MFHNKYYSLEETNGTIRFAQRNRTLAGLSGYHLVYGSIHYLRCPIIHVIRKKNLHSY